MFSPSSFSGLCISKKSSVIVFRKFPKVFSNFASHAVYNAREMVRKSPDLERSVLICPAVSVKSSGRLCAHLLETKHFDFVRPVRVQVESYRLQDILHSYSERNAS